MYKPEPTDTSMILLDPQLILLTELLAKNTHEVWAYNRIEEGWVYGQDKDDELKTHPCLIPYEELSELEKDYDRRTAMETVKLIVKLGYAIEKE